MIVSGLRMTQLGDRLYCWPTQETTVIITLFNSVYAVDNVSGFNVSNCAESIYGYCRVNDATYLATLTAFSLLPSSMHPVMS